MWWLLLYVLLKDDHQCLLEVHLVDIGVPWEKNDDPKNLTVKWAAWKQVSKLYQIKTSQERENGEEGDVKIGPLLKRRES